MYRRISLRAVTVVLLFAGISSAETPNRVTILYDSFGKAPALTLDWGFAALVEYGGKRILFDTGNNAKIFEHNVKALGVDLQSGSWHSLERYSDDSNSRRFTAAGKKMPQQTLEFTEHSLRSGLPRAGVAAPLFSGRATRSRLGTLGIGQSVLCCLGKLIRIR